MDRVANPFSPGTGTPPPPELAGLPRVIKTGTDVARDAASDSKTLWTMDNIVALIDAAAPAPKPRGPSKKAASARAVG